MRRFIIALTLVWLAQFAVSEDLSAAGSPETLKFNISTGGYPPYTIVYADGSVSGIFWDALSLITSRLGMELEPVQIPPKRSDSLLDQGYSDVTMRAIEWTAHPESYFFSDPVMTTRDAIFVHRGAPVVKNLDDLRGTLLTRLGFSYPWLQARLEDHSVQLIPVQKQEPLFKRLYQGGPRFVGAVSDLHAGQWVLKNHPSWDEVIDEAPIRLKEISFRLMFPARHADLVPAINRELENLKESGELERIIDAYRPH